MSDLTLDLEGRDRGLRVTIVQVEHRKHGFVWAATIEKCRLAQNGKAKSTPIGTILARSDETPADLLRVIADFYDGEVILEDGDWDKLVEQERGRCLRVLKRLSE